MFLGMSPNEVMGRVVYLCKFIFFFLFFFFFFFFRVVLTEVWFLLSGAGGEPLHHLEVPFQRGEGYVGSVQDGGFGGREL